MRTGAVIVASAKSKHTNRFRPTLRMGEGSMVRCAAEAFLSAGVDRVVVVTGLHADRVAEELRGLPVELLHDAAYAASDMLASAKLGIRACLTDCERIFITPVAIPGFSAKTVARLLQREERVCIPVQNGIGGHPLLICAEIAQDLLAYEGEDGLRGGLRVLGETPVRVPVDEDGDPKRQFSAKVQVRLVGKTPFFGPGPQQLLLGIRSRGSVAEACRAIGISYSKGRTLLRQMEKELGFSLVDRVQGGEGGGSACLTKKGEIFLENFSRYARSVADYAAEIFSDYFEELEE